MNTCDDPSDLVTHKMLLAPPAERQRSFSNAELSVVCLGVRPASTFHL